MAATAASEQGPPLSVLPGGSHRLAVIAEGDDRKVILDMLAGADTEAVPASLSELADALADDRFAGAIVTDACLRGFAPRELEAAVERQPPWSDFPFVVIVDRHSLDEMSGIIARLGKVTIVERPVHSLVLKNAARAALRARCRQREAVRFLLQRQDAEEHLRQLTTTLEKRVRERMWDLRAANQRLKQEVHERLAAEERLRESEELYRFTVELSQQMVWTASPEGTMVTVNLRFYEVTGASPGMSPHDAWLSLLHPDDSERLMEFWTAALATGHPYHAQFRMRVADGSYRSFVARAAPRRDEEGKVVRWYGFTEDVTEQKRADAARREAEERYRLAARATNDAIWDLDPVGNRIHWTAAETAFFGYRDDQQMTTLKWWADRLHPEDRARVTQGLKAALAGRASDWEESYRFLKADGEYADVVDQGFIIRDDEGLPVRMVGAMSDLTDHRRAEAEIRQIQSELIHVSRLSAMGTMASTLAHELNQPLTAVSSYIRGSRRLLEQGSVDLAPVQEAMEAAEGAALRAGHIVKRLRELVARGNVSPRAEQLPKVIHDASMIAFLDAHLLGVTYKIELDEQAQWVEVDPIQIQQVVINLVRNAIQAVEGQPRREIVIRTSALSRGTAEVSVSDTGGGIPDEVRSALFSPFRSSKPGGIGIGLSISRTIVEAHGGKIWAEDAGGDGTVFRFTLPRAGPPEEMPA